MSLYVQRKNWGWESLFFPRVWEIHHWNSACQPCDLVLRVELWCRLAMVAHTCNLSNGEAEAGGLPRVWGQFGLHSESKASLNNTGHLSQRKKKKNCGTVLHLILIPYPKCACSGAKGAVNLTQGLRAGATQSHISSPLCQNSLSTATICHK